MINSIDEIISSIKKGEMVIIMDDESRENEGDLVMASQFVKATDINFMASKGRGLICLTLTESKCKDLDLPLLKQSGGESSKETNFTVSIDAIKGVTTGISASDRAKTIQLAVKRNAKAKDFAQPGHIFPIMAKNGGVLTNLGGYNENFYYAQDYKLMKDLIEKKYKVKIIKKPLYELNMENNISSLYRKEQEYYAKCVRKDITPV